jgi:AcrR family transcriptional regulator
MARLTTSERIARAARRLLEREGSAAVSMRRVADAVGITPMAIYRHFPNREALLHQVTTDSFNAIAQDWSGKATDADVGKQLLRMHEAYLDYALAQPHVFDHAFGVSRPDARRFPDDFRARRSPTATLVADALSDGMREGVLRKDDVWDVGMALWAQAHGLICLYRAGRFSYDETEFRAFYRASLRRMLDGLKA